MIDVTKLDNNIDLVTFQGIEKFNALVADDARVSLERLFDSPNARVVLDLSGISYIDSSGFGCFLNTMKTARNNYGTLKICCIKPDVKTLFTVCSFIQFLNSMITSKSVLRVYNKPDWY